MYNLSDEQIEYQVRDRMSFTRFLGLEFEDDIPDGTTLWVFREKLGQAGLVEKLFERFNQHLNAKGYIARGGQMVDATIVAVPKQRNSREENETVKRGETPGAWEETPAKNRQRQRRALDQETRQELFRLYPVHVMTRKSFGLMMRKLSVTESQRSAQFPGTFSRRKTERRIGELGASCVALVVSDVSVHEAP